ncbi:MAG: hypothetical protein HY290_05160, partial [Planctomycetia bacterium]|nr:hypothetical protein [Planctomycetia bacterium]
AVSSAQHPGNYSLYFDIDTGDPLIDGPPFVRALETALAALKKMPADVAKFRPADCRNEVVSGRAALAIVSEPPEFAAPDETHTQAAATGRQNGNLQFGVVRLPGSREVYDASRKLWEPLPDKGIARVTLTAFAGWGIGAASSATSGQIDAAWNSLLKVGGPDLVSGFPLPVIWLCRESQSAGQAPSADLPGAAAGACTQTVAESLRDSRLVAELPIAGRHEFRQALARELGAAIEGSKSAEEALHAVAASWRETIARIGKYQHRDNYRSSLGLSPKPRD